MRKRLARLASYLLLLTCLTAASAPCYGQQFGQEEAAREGKKRWLWSAVALVAASALDAHSSQGRMEANPLLRGSNGTFSSRRAFLVKGAANGGVLLLQAILIKKMPDRNLYKSFALTNSIMAGVTAGTALRNYQMAPAPAPAPAPPPPEYVLREGGL
jgi:hypothetical protein